MRLKDVLGKKLSAKEQLFLRASFDTVGNIALIEIPAELRKKQKLIANAVLAQNPAIKSVFKKVGAHKGKFRTQKLVWLAGKKTTETIHKESGALMQLDVVKCYFSPRLVGERLRIARLVKPGEKVLVLFSGVAPYALILAKHSPAKKIVAIEKNPVAHKYAVLNQGLNKVPAERLVLLRGDVKKKMPALKEKFDRIIMPLPKESELFLELVLSKLKKKGMIHLYQFANEAEFGVCAQKIVKKCLSLGYSCQVLRVVKSGQSAPRTYRVCIDLEVK